jgi:TM2 domain-containing membrane protein YozV
MPRNPWLAAGLSFVVAGLGQFYVGEYWRGLAFIILELGTGYVYLSVSEPAGAVLNLAVGAASMVDAYWAASRADGRKPEPPKVEVPVVKVY